MNKEEKAITLWDLFRYGRGINDSFMSIRLMNLLRYAFTDDDMKSIMLADMLHLDILRIRNAGMKSANEFRVKQQEFLSKNGCIYASQLTECKEALRELVELAPVVIDPCVAETYFEALECRRKYIEVSRRAKTLIE